MNLSHCATKMWCKVGWVVCGVSHIPTLHLCHQPHDGPHQFQVQVACPQTSLRLPQNGTLLQ